MITSVTIAEFIEAIRKNGLTQIFGDFFSEDMTGGCAIGQACYNLGITTYLESPTTLVQDLYKRTVILNDVERLPLSEIATTLKSEYADHLNENIMAYELEY